MEFSVNNGFNATDEIAASGAFPGIRLFTAARAVASSPQDDVDAKTAGTRRPTLMMRASDARMCEQMQMRMRMRIVWVHEPVVVRVVSRRPY